MVKVYLIRHAESEGNIFRVCQGQSEMLLTGNGNAQCEALEKRFRGIRLDAVYTSDLYRAGATAFAAAKGSRAPVFPDRRLREVRLGFGEGMSWGQIEREKPGFFDRLHAGEHFPACENDSQVRERMLRCMEEYPSRHPGGTIAVVSHGGAIRNWLEAAMPEEAERFGAVTQNTSVTTLLWDSGAWKLEEYNSVSHLERAGLSSYSLFGTERTELWYREGGGPEDRGLVLEMSRDAWQVVFGNLREWDPDRFYRNVLRMAATPHCVNICMDGDTPAGLLFLDPLRLDEPRAGHVSELYLAPAYRGRGIGAQLLGRAVSVYRNMDRGVLRLQAARRNKPALRFYKKHGFSAAGLPSLSGQMMLRKEIAIPDLWSGVKISG